MKAQAMNLRQLQAWFVTEDKCTEALKQKRWTNGFKCPHYGHDQGHWVVSRKVYQCNHCRRLTSVTAGTLFHSTNLPLVQWFLAIYLMVCDKGSLSALHLSKRIGVSWMIAHQMLRKMPTSWRTRAASYRLGDLRLLYVPGVTQQYKGCVKPPEQVDEWLLWMHIAIGNLQCVLAGNLPWSHRQIPTGTPG